VGSGARRALAAPAKQVLRPVVHRVRAVRQAGRVRTDPVLWSDVERLCAMEADPDDIAPAIERLLVENLLPYWNSEMLDAVGGYRSPRDRPGQSARALVFQARVLWFFARLAQSRYGTPQHHEAARHGFEFLVDRLHDDEFGGYHWAVDHAGRPVPVHPQAGDALPVKDVCGQSFALYALSQYALASGSAEAERHARELFAVLDDKARDRSAGGFHELFAADWGPLPRGLVMGADRGDKTFRTQVHLIEALTPYVQLTGDDAARAALGELVELATTAMVFDPVGVGVQILSRDWKPVLSDSRNVHVYGHDLELITLVLSAQRVLGTHPADPTPVLRRLFAGSVWWGMDRDEGGFFLQGRIAGPATDRSKLMWAQAEGLGTAVALYALTGEDVFSSVAMRTLGWVTRRQADWSRGEWYEVVAPDGSIGAGRGDAWGSPYHNGRALLGSLELLG
jgi:mannobiose 2-epimerase